VRLAARGTREVDGGVEPVADEAERSALRRRARGVWAASALLAAIGTTVIMALPL